MPRFTVAASLGLLARARPRPALRLLKPLRMSPPQTFPFELIQCLPHMVSTALGSCYVKTLAYKCFLTNCSWDETVNHDEPHIGSSKTELSSVSYGELAGDDSLITVSLWLQKLEVLFSQGHCRAGQ